MIRGMEGREKRSEEGVGGKKKMFGPKTYHILISKKTEEDEEARGRIRKVETVWSLEGSVLGKRQCNARSHLSMMGSANHSMTTSQLLH